jgi:threonine dehydrogenase-like Zn-dependent dehydrogenase
MRALQVVTPRSFTRVEIPVPDLKTLAPDRILVRPYSVSMCGSDISFFTGNKRHKTYPLPVGAPIHECAGTVLAFGVPDQTVYAVEYETLFRKNLHLIASVTPAWSEFLVKSRDIFLSAWEEFGKFVTHHFPIRDAEKAFRHYESREDGIIKALINMSDW